MKATTKYSPFSYHKLQVLIHLFLTVKKVLTGAHHRPQVHSAFFYDIIEISPHMQSRVSHVGL